MKPNSVTNKAVPAEQPATNENPITTVANKALPRTLGYGNIANPHIHRTKPPENPPEPPAESAESKGHHGLPTCDSEILRRSGKI